MEEKTIKGPVKKIPKKMLRSYTMKGKIPVFNKYLEENVSSNEPVMWPKEMIEDYCKRFKKSVIIKEKHGWERYKGASLVHCQAFDQFPVKGKTVAVIGSQNPWIEAILINYEAKSVTTVEYNVPVCGDDRIQTISWDDFDKSDVKYDIIITYSSVEHSGLGRYGDVLDPIGDLKVMRSLHSKLVDSGLIYWGAPVSKQDALYWNAHRIYGPIRSKKIFKHYKKIKQFNIPKNKQRLTRRQVQDIKKKRKCVLWTQPVIILQRINEEYT